MNMLKTISLSMLTALLFALPITYAHAQDITTGLVGHWRLDETTGTTAFDSTGSNDGTMDNGLTGADSAQGIVERALNLDGNNDAIVLGDIHDTMTDFSISAWVNGRDFTGGSGANINAIVGKEQVSANRSYSQSIIN